MDILDDFCFDVIHVDGVGKTYEQRKECVKNIKANLNGKIRDINAESIRITSQQDIFDFQKRYPEFKIKKDGITDGSGQGWRLGEIGLWASNFMAINKFLDSKYEYLLLLEDDIVLEEDFAERLVKVFFQIPEDWDVLSIYAPLRNYKNYKEEEHDIGEKDVCISYHQWATPALLFNKKSAKQLYDYMTKEIDVPVDWLFYWRKDTYPTALYAIKPESKQLVSRYPSKTTIQIQEREIING